ncbi:hypothetical protein D3C84_1049870 [compost metagenome]
MAPPELQNDAQAQALTLDCLGQCRIGCWDTTVARRVTDDFHTHHQSSAAYLAQASIAVLQLAQSPHESLPHDIGMSRQVFADDMAQRRSPRCHRHLIAAECAGMGTRFPGIQLFAVHHHG